MRAATAASLALHALGLWTILRARLTEERPIPEEPMLVEVIEAERIAESGALPARRSLPRIEREPAPAVRAPVAPAAQPAPVSKPKSLALPPLRDAPGAESAQEAAIAPAPPPRPPKPMSLALLPHFDAPVAKPRPAFDPRAFPAEPLPPMETPGIDLDSVLEFKRGQERPQARLPEVFDKWLRGREVFAKPRPDYSIQHRKDGSARYQDERADRFSATVSPDGSLAFEDHHLHGPNFTEQFKKWIEDPFHNAPPMPSLVIGLDITDEIMRAYGQDPYADIKRKLLASTLEERQRMADVYRRETMAAALVGLRAYLRALWTDPSRSTAENRRLLQALADETDDSAGGHRAREIILEFLNHFEARDRPHPRP
jgi:hypothetical protein